MKNHRSHVNRGRGSNRWLEQKIDRKLKRELKMLRIDRERMHQTKRKRGKNG